MAALHELTPSTVQLFERLLSAGELEAGALQRSLATAPGGPAALTSLVQLGLARLTTGPDGAALVGLGSTATLRRLAEAPGTAAAQRLLRARLALSGSLEQQRGPSGTSVTVADRAELTERLQRLGREVGEELVSLHAGAVPEGPALDAHLASDLELVARGVRVRVVYSAEAASSPQLRTYAAALAAVGAEIRVAGGVPHRLVVADAREAVVPVDNASLAAGAVFTTDPTLVRRLHRLADTLFDNASPLDEAPSAAVPGVRPPTPLERRVLHLMSSGVTDEVAASRLGVTDRTFRRYVSSILKHLGATSRFQAGLRAIEHGWL
ncbi:hypothetical protein GB931_12730 [Modestobacter sp. I12A-02628]|uniref:Helix-turn-helix transcriptional regulator n=1 Tax=Goekera deserti TaxID=2497753 RepID=A0A7K3W9D1_9ACTN|nr:helix-turn-helix transcriptional regulator [Goekera deserti]MPQ98770.1 hypothetical protein [Goekera deserti]NDI49732.1 hypothetical protein [Goekera deserti]NEL53075.1 helix-turn-helix transcriptional regulator [Goekera deserti]